MQEERASVSTSAWQEEEGGAAHTIFHIDFEIEMSEGRGIGWEEEGLRLLVRLRKREGEGGGRGRKMNNKLKYELSRLLQLRVRHRLPKRREA